MPSSLTPSAASRKPDAAQAGGRVKVLFDQGTPAPLRRSLAAHVVHTAYEMGWFTLTNGELLRAAESAGFEAIVTTDKNIRHQQDIAGRRFGVLVLPTTDWATIRRHIAEVVESLGAVRPGEVRQMSFDD